MSITYGIRSLRRPQWAQIQVPTSPKGKTLLIWCDFEGNTQSARIGKKVAEMLIARGMAYGS